MKIVIDVMSGDKAPLEPIKGALLAARSYNAEICIVGTEEVIYKTAELNHLDLSPLTLIFSNTVIHMDDPALSVVRDKKDSSMAVGLQYVADGKADVFISCGNTGALLAGATLIIRRITGIQRAGIATILPFENPVLLMDSGANLEVTPSNLEQFAFMGAKYMEKVFEIKNPRIGLLNNGTESTKGTEVLRSAYLELKDSELNFVGNIEGKKIPNNLCDVLVTDGFTGNVVLKYTEGMGRFMIATLKDIIGSNLLTKIAAFSIKKKLLKIKKQFSSSSYGGAPILGVSKPVIKAHGSSNDVAIKHAVKQAINFYNSQLIREIAMYAIGFQERMKQREKRRAEEKKNKNRV